MNDINFRPAPPPGSSSDSYPCDREEANGKAATVLEQYDFDDDAEFSISWPVAEAGTIAKGASTSFVLLTLRDGRPYASITLLDRELDAVFTLHGS